MSALEDVLAGNRRYAEGGSAPIGQPRSPARRLIVIACMDARIDPIRALGLQAGDANVIRNAGAPVTDDVVRSVELSRTVLGTTAAFVVGHTDCAGYGSDAEAEAAVGAGVARLRSAVPEGFEVHGLMYDVRTARLRVV